MAKAKKTKSGRWRIRVYNYTDENGKRIYECITRDTKAECELAAAEFNMNGRGKKLDPIERTVGEVVDQYIGLCRILSPTTVSGYEKIRRTGFPHLWDVPIGELTPTSIQAAVNTEAMREGRRGRISPKTLANEWGLISSSLWKICGLKFDVRLPQRVKKIREYPEPAAVMEAVRGSSVELPCLLALWLSFTMSEIRGLMWSDIQGDTITINRVMVDVDGVPTVKETGKTDARIRRHRLPAYLQQLLNNTPHDSDFIVPLNHSEIFGRFRRLCERQGIDLRFHDLRHLNASVMLQLNVPEKYAMERGGWKTPNVMKTVYQHTFSSQRQIVDDQIDAYFEKLLPPEAKV